MTTIPIPTNAPAAPEMPEAVLVIVHVPPTFRGLPVSEVRRKFAHPANLTAILDQLAASVVEHFNQPVDLDRVITALAAARPDGGPKCN